jgi:hypothetical protein
MKLTYVRRPCGTDEPKTLMFIDSTWPTNVRHVVPQPLWCHVGLMFVGSMTNITATWQTWPATSTPRGSYVRRGTDKYKIFFLKNLFCLPPQPGSLQNRYTIYKQQQTHIQYITIQHVKHHKYRSNTTATHQNPNIKSPRMHRSSLRRVVVLRPSTACVERRLGERISLWGVMLWVWNL